MDGPSHLLSLKVMRVSRPSLASSWEPFYSSSPSLSAHSTASILSLQGKAPLPNHPKTLRDLTHASEILTLPSSFGAIQLGETFSSCLCVNNESAFDIEGVRLRVEMQTATAKVVLAELGGDGYRLMPHDTLENVVSHEIKELGQHVLGCTVAYRAPPNVRHLPGSAEDPNDPSLQTFRKFYKFSVSNPLSVKTKVHAPRSPSALLSLQEREKIFLEVHIQNLMPDPVWFERMQFQPTDEWKAEDINTITPDDSIFSGSMALMQPQDMRQYIYILTPASIPLVPVVLTPGSTIPLGRLDISWRSSFGEPGRLLTSMLSRRIPIPTPAPAQPTASALPAYLKRSQSIVSIPSRPQSRPASPPPGQRPGSPFRNRPQTPIPNRTQSPALGQPHVQHVPTPLVDVEVTLLIRSINHPIRVENPFTIACSLVIVASIKEAQSRTLRLAVQRLSAGAPAAVPSAVQVAMNTTAFSPRMSSSGFSTPSSTPTAFNIALVHNKILAATPRQSVSEEPDEIKDDGGSILPPPYFNDVDEARTKKLSGVRFLGQSSIFLPPIEFSYPETAAQESNGAATKVQVVQDFDLDYIPLQQGFVSVGGLRVLLVDDKVETGNIATESRIMEVRTLKEWGVIAEACVGY